MEGLKLGQQAPEFTAITLQGDEVTKDTYAQRSVAFVFVSPSCSPCHEVVSEFETLKERALEIGLDMVLVSMTTFDITRKYIKETAKVIDLPVLVAPQGENPFTQDYKVSGTPYLCRIDRLGKVQAAGPFASEWQALMQNHRVS
jgi:peroxiredoxin